MRIGLLIIGVILFVGAMFFLVIGAILLITGYNGSQQYLTVTGQIVRGLSQQAQNDYSNYMLMELIGGVVSLVSGVVALIGAVLGICGIVLSKPVKVENTPIIKTK